ncbi:ABC transporter ATP-binding protein [Mycoplasmatota bacterium WC44]
MGKDILKMEDIYLIYPNGIVANQNVNFSLKKGEIHALLGENGAGKSSLMKVLFGIHQPQEGKITLKGEEINISSPSVAIENGLGMVHQHFMLVPSFSVAENIVLGVEPKKNVFMDMEKAIEISNKIAKENDFHIDVEEKIENLPVGIKQKVEILKALYRGAEILILDEPTAVLTPQETEELFKQLNLLKEKGHTIIFISHKLDEIKAICDRLTILRHGKTMGTYETKDISKEEISRLMVGRDVILKIDKEKASPKDVILNVKNLSVKNYTNKEVVKNISFGLREGEILGIAGVEGNGQSELIETITGINNTYHGEVTVRNKNIKGMSIKEIRDLDYSHIPEDRMTYGVASDMDITSNLIANIIDDEEYSNKGLLKKQSIIDLSNRLIKDFLIKCKSGAQRVGMLSGGNIQKVVVAREMFKNPKLIVANQPTRGIDVGAAQFIREKLVELRDNGSGVLLVSADLNEVFELCDSIIVMHKGEIVAYFDDIDKLTEKELGMYMLGLEKQDDVGGVTYE